MSEFYTPIRDKINELLLSVTGIGSVHKSRRHASDEKTFRELFSVGGVINTCWYWRADSQENLLGDETADRNFMVDRSVKSDWWVIHLMYGFKDNSSEFTFQELVERVEDKFRFTDAGVFQNYGGLTWRSYPLQRIDSGVFIFFGNVMCHRAEWRLQTEYDIHTT